MAKLLVDWPCPKNVKAVYSDRLAGASLAPYDSYNLGDHVGDDASAVQSNRQHFQQGMPQQVCWLKQIHSTRVVNASESNMRFAEADASFAMQQDAVCVVMTADCLPVLFCDKQGTVVAAAHAGWRGLLDGVLENTVAAMNIAPSEIMAWFGPAIGPDAFEVGAEVYQQFVAKDSKLASAFKASVNSGKYYADIHQLAKQRLSALGLNDVYADASCTLNNASRFFSYRRDGQTGRMAAAIWLS
ncbi:peptidoglycan editing factor PgeF [Agarivorans sp. B2Z047]|uniref:peptidoglycan editing factor PgeF n=1 Tax=Agarivorans sp. B2Z047 TaxID=2652721 RepID=UPI00128D82B7|nr:peptidoglycan editing factor PgeF [Agarivorans sp. B2Z047]MPW30798.1 peptidoglycan editing factor PgeF [Agarivorans sp. B2Z047]UQN41981.1 peptidoglycan editing factor PgeF [Agarivorans sp. B2Z047]